MNNNKIEIIFNGFSDIEKNILENLPDKNIHKVFIKPNWVVHETSPEFPIEALVTSTDLIDKIITVLLKKYTNLTKITIGDIPLQSCDWDIFTEQIGLQKLIDKYSCYDKPVIQFLDLRKEIWVKVKGFMEQKDNVAGDPLGYTEIILNEKSYLEEVSHNSNNFRVSDYDPKETTSVHKKGLHKFLVSSSMLDSDLFINVPKMKTHQKSGVTGALKNLVGMNGSKAYLVHHQKGFKSTGGDEFPDDINRIVFLQVRLGQAMQKKYRILFKFLKIVWKGIKKLFKIETELTKEALQSTAKPFIGSGSWYGNDSIWRMVYDLNMVILFGLAGNNKLQDKPVREYVAILDGVISGEGNGPLQPIPVNSNLIALSRNPFLIDFAIAKLMGFDYKKIPLLNYYRRFNHAEWNSFEPHKFDVNIDTKESSCGIDSIPVIKNYLAPPGWRNHIEL